MENLCLYPKKIRQAFFLVLILCSALGAGKSSAQVAASDFVVTVRTNSLEPLNSLIGFYIEGSADLYYESIPAGISGTIALNTALNFPELPTPGTYRIAFKPKGAVPMRRISFAIVGPFWSLKLLTIEQWGTTVWSAFTSAFETCINLTAISATDAPILTNVTSMESMFSGCSTLSSAPNIKNWDVSHVTNMALLFSNTDLFNEPVGDWDVSHATFMYGMFSYSKSFNQPLNSWDVSNVTDMRFMFRGALAFNQPLNDWNVGNVTTLLSTFEGAASFNQPLDSWDVSNVTDMFSTFFGAASFNQPLNTWDVGNVTNFGGMFYNASSFNQPLDNWDVGDALDMNSMFAYATAFNQPLNTWDLSNVTAINYMFYEASAFNQPLNNWNVSNVTTMAFMFTNATAFSQDLGDWTLNADVNLGNMFSLSGMNCSAYSSTLIGWAGNPATPTGRVLTAGGVNYGPDATIARTFLTGTKGWTITGDSFDANCSLPVTLTSFDVTRQEFSSILSWATTEETNSDYFEIQRSQDGHAWKAVGSRTSGGESKVLKTYYFQDYTPALGINYYRLKMVDKDKTFSYSRIRSLDFSDQAAVSLYPNPASDKLLIKNYSGVKQVTIYNAAGAKVIQTGTVTAQGIDVSGLSPGSHTVKLIFSDGVVQFNKIVVVK